MGQIKEPDVDNKIVIIDPDPAPLERIERDQLRAVVEQVKVRVRSADKMTDGELATIAQEAILYRIIPGQDVHYFPNEREEKDGTITRTLERVFDYKYLMNLAHWMESRRTGLPNPQLEPIFPPLDEKARIREGLGQNDVAAYCTLVSQADRQLHQREVKAYIDMGLKPELAVETVERLYGRPGTTAIGVVQANDFRIPKGWSKLAKAQKLALKNAIMRRYGLPSVDEMIRMARERAILAQPKDWSDVDPFLPHYAQARFADTTAIAREVEQDSKGMTIQEHHDRLQQNGVLLHGPENDVPIGEDYAEQDWQRFVERILKEIPFYTDETSIKQSLGDFEYSPETEQECFDKLAYIASQKADAIAQEK